MRLAPLLAIPAAILLATLARTSPPDPRGAGAGTAEFSAERALATVRALAGDAPPRPLGSAADRRAAELVLAQLRALGLDASVQETFACGPYGTCGTARNVVARLGAAHAGRRAVLVAAHLDSAAAGPGASDDLSGVAAVVEVARALSAGPPPDRPVIFLLTDGEEAGLIGASAFVASPLVRDVGAAVNLDARGTAGPSILFRTSGAPAWLPRALAALPRPVTTSVAPAIHALLPNDTDLTAFERAGVPGVDLAFAAGAARYHTPRDDLFHLDPASLQHQGENALALVRALSAADLEDARATPRAWFDLLSATVVSWRWPREVGIAAALLALLAAVGAVRREPRPVRAAAFGLAAALAGPLLAASVAAALAAGLRAAGVLPRPFVAHPAPIEAAACLAGVGGALLAPAFLARRAGRAGLLAGSALLFAALSAALALKLPLATPVAVVPALAFAVAEGLREAAPPGRSDHLAAALPAAAAALPLAPVVVLLPSVLGTFAVPLTALLVALVLGPAVAGAERASTVAARPGVAALAAAALLAAVQAARPHASVDAPEKLTFTFHEDASGARWLAEAEHDRALPAVLRAAAPFTPSRRPPFAWTPLRPAFSAPTASAGLPRPRAELLSVEVRDGVRRVRARLWSPRGAPTVALLLPPSARVRAASVDGVRLGVPPRAALWTFGDHRLVACMTTPPHGVTVELAFDGEAPVAALLADRSPGLPPSGAALVAARPSTAVPFWDGDGTVATSDVRL